MFNTEEQFFQIVEPLPHKSEVVESNQEERPFVKERERIYERVSLSHRRSLEQRDMSGNVLWGSKHGEYTILHGATSEKGLPFTEPRVQTDVYTDNGFRVRGLQDKSHVENVQLASDYLMSHGLPTEEIREVKKLTHVTVKGRDMTIPQLKKWLLEQWCRDVESNDNLNPKIYIPLVEDFLDDEEFVITERDYQVKERLRDVASLYGDQDQQIFVDMMRRIFFWLNTQRELIRKSVHAEKQTKYTDIEYTDSMPELDANNTEHIVQYFSEYLPSLMGQYLAKMNNLEVTHNYATGHNWSGVGTLYDLDSVGGEPLGDDPVTREDIAENLLTSVRVITSLHYVNPMIKSRLNLIFEQFIKTDDLTKYSKLAKESLLSAYMQFRIFEDKKEQQELVEAYHRLCKNEDCVDLEIHE